MNANTYFDREDALAGLLLGHIDETRASAEALLDDDGFCGCCGVDYTGQDRDTH